MTVVRTLLLALSASLAMALSASAQESGRGAEPSRPAQLPAAEPTDVSQEPERIAAAMELIEVTGAKKQIELMLDMMKQGVGAGARDAGGKADAAKAKKHFSDFTKRFKSYRDKMIEEFAGIYAARFTADELKAISSFYRSGAGAKFIAAMPELMQEGAEIGQKYGLMAVRELKALKNRKTKP